MDTLSTTQDSSLLKVMNLSVHFGGLKAVDNVDFNIQVGELFGLIGPNGAGKTTIFNAITSTVPTSGGSVHFLGEEIQRLKPHEVAKRGMVRLFQAATIFPSMPVLDHIKVGLHCRTSTTYWGALLRTPYSQKEESKNHRRCIELIEYTSLAGLENQPAGSLSWAQQKKLMLATALAVEPKLILLDEPVAGMNADEIVEMIGLISNIREHGITVFVIDHNMKVMMNICDRMMVMNFGQKLTEGIPETIAQDPRVIEAYLGYSRQ
jgi:branched-chain amino acid transport system ATP-binding protein